MQKVTELLDHLNISFRWRAFIISFFAIFFMVCLQYLGFKLPNLTPQTLISPINSKEDVIEIITPRLTSISNRFTLQKKQSFVKEASADSEKEYDKASAYLAVNLENGEIINEKNLSKKLPIASITKIISAVVALDLLSVNDLIDITEHAASIEPTKIGVVAGEKMTLKEALNASLLVSANDATEVIKEGVDKKYGKGIFIKAMNIKAKYIGMKNSNFTNAQGFDNPNHYSSVEDLALLAKYTLDNYPLIAEIVKKDYEFLPKDSNHKQFDLYNWNGLLGTYPGVSGFKIGNTGQAGYTTSIVSEREGKRIFAVLLNAPRVLERDLWTSQLLDDSFEKLAGLTPVGLTEIELKAKYSTWKYWN